MQVSKYGDDICGHEPNFLTDEEIEQLYSVQTKKFGRAGTRYRGIDKSLRDCWKMPYITMPPNIWEKLWNQITLFNKNTYKFKLYDDVDKHEFNIIRYNQKGQFFTAHRDERPNLSHVIRRIPMRKISITVQLSDESEYGGSDLQIAETFTRKDVLSEPTLNIDQQHMPESKFRHQFKTLKKKGSLTIFTSFQLHNITPLEWGSRDVLVCFIQGESQVW